MCATVKSSLRFDAMADDFASAVLADRRELMDGAFEAVECMGVSGRDHLEGKIVVVAADFAPSHSGLL
jgi:hypothetical protein